LAVGLAANPLVVDPVQTGSTFPTVSLPVYSEEAFLTLAVLGHAGAPRVNSSGAGMPGQQVGNAGHYADNMYSVAGPSAPQT